MKLAPVRFYREAPGMEPYRPESAHRFEFLPGRQVTARQGYIDFG